MKQCPSCGKTFPDKVNFCGKCGVALVEIDANSSLDRKGETEEEVEPTVALDLNEVNKNLPFEKDDKKRKEEVVENRIVKQEPVRSNIPQDIPEKTFEKSDHEFLPPFSYKEVFSTIFKHPLEFLMIPATLVFIYMGMLSLPLYLSYLSIIFIAPFVLGVYKIFFDGKQNLNNYDAAGFFYFFKSGNNFWTGFVLYLITISLSWISLLLLSSFNTVAIIIGIIFLIAALIFFPVLFGISIFIFLDKKEVPLGDALSKGISAGTRFFGELTVFSLITTSISFAAPILFYIINIIIIKNSSPFAFTAFALNQAGAFSSGTVFVIQFFSLLELITLIFGISFFIKAWCDKYFSIRDKIK